jgi:hypothetical protein
MRAEYRKTLSHGEAHWYANPARLSSTPERPEKESVRPAFFPLAAGSPDSLEATSAKLREEARGVGTERVGEMDHTIGAEVALEEGAKRTVALRVVHELGAEDYVERAAERAVDEIELNATHVLEAVLPSAFAYELECGPFAIDEPDLSAERRGDETRQAEAAPEIEHGLSRQAATVGQAPGEGAASGPEMRPVWRFRNEIVAQQRLAVDQIFEACDLIERHPHLGVLEFDQGCGIAGDLANAWLAIRLGHLAHHRLRDERSEI